MISRDMLSLKGKLLVAMPSMPDERFSHSVIFMCEHGEGGAMGLIVNKFLRQMDLSQILEEDTDVKLPEREDWPVHYGGPVERERGFVLHSSDYRSDESTVAVTDDVCMTSTKDVLQEIQKGGGPKLALLALGYSGWAPGQIEQEIQQNGWLVAEPTSDLLFIAKDEDKWVKSLKSIGVDPSTLSNCAGSA